MSTTYRCDVCKNERDVEDLTQMEVVATTLAGNDATESLSSRMPEAVDVCDACIDGWFELVRNAFSAQFKTPRTPA